VLCWVRLGLSLVFSGTSFLSWAQSAPATSATQYSLLPPAVIISKEVNEVSLAFTVTDHRGHFVSNLRPQDFRLLDNQHSPDRFTFFQQRSDLPLHLAVLIDASNSVKSRFRLEQQAALTFVKSVLRREKDKAFVIAFNDDVTTIQDVTDRTAKISKAIGKAKAGGNTALYDAVTYACDKLRRTPEEGITRRAIVLISDGEDTVSRFTLAEARLAATRAAVMIFSLSTNEADPGSEGDAVLMQLALATGGKFLPAYNDVRLYFSLRKIEKTLRNQYVVAYNPPEFQADGSYHEVKVVPLRMGLWTDCRKGYYARAGQNPGSR
jgi:Ca-activated chloride channel homolog